MSLKQVTANSQLQRESMPDSPQGGWFDTLLDFLNQLGRQVVAVVNGLPARQVVTYVMSDATVTPVPNPLGETIVGVVPISCVGLTLDSAGKETGATYDLAIPSLQWKMDGGRLSLKVTFAIGGARGSVSFEVRGA